MPELRFDFIKSNFFRVVHADGVHGGMTPNGAFQLVFFNERYPIPQSVVHEVSDEGQLGDEVPSKRVMRESVVREAEVDVVLSPEVARNVYLWLKQQLEAEVP